VLILRVSVYIQTSTRCGIKSLFVIGFDGSWIEREQPA